MFSSKQLYKTVSLNEYQQAKKTEINALTYNYAYKRDVDKWDLLISRLAENIPDPVSQNISRTQFINALNQFKQQRQTGDANLFNLSLHDCLDYFENFYFLYTTKNPRFKLNPAKKEKLLEAIFDAMGTCETGINTRFNMVMQLYRTDLDWVTNCLSQQRYQLISALHDRFNYERHVGEAYQVHVLNIMLKEAKAAGFGVQVAHSVHDVYENSIPNISKSDVRAYFKQHAPRIFSEDYEAKILETLSQHLMFELNELYQPDHDYGAPWSQKGRTLEGDDITAFNKLIEDRLGFAGAGGELGDSNEEYTQFTLKPRAEFFELLKRFVQEKINREGYFLTLDNLNHYSLSDLYWLSDLYSLSDLKNFNFPHGVTARALIEVNEAILACDADNLETIKRCRAALIKHAPVVLNYPDLVLERAKTNPVLLSNLPKALTNDAHFLGQAVVAVDALLGQAEEAEEQRRFTSLLLRLVQHDKSFLNKCSTLTGRQLFDDYARHMSIGKDYAISQLSETESLGFSQTARFAQKITLNELIAVIAHRKARNLPPLPFCEDDSALSRFKEALGRDHMSAWNRDGLTSFRSEACKRVRLGEEKPLKGGDSALTYLAKHELWFVAMVRHQYAHTGRFKTFAQFWFVFKQWLMRLAEILCHVTLDILIIVCGIILAVMAIILVAMIPPLVVLAMLALFLACLGLSQILENRELAIVAVVVGLCIASIFALHQVVIACTMWVSITHVTEYILPVLNEFYKLSALIFTRTVAMFSPDEFAYTPDTTGNEVMVCDKIIADLAVGGDEHAIEKVDALVMLQDKIRTDDEPGEHLNKRYTFFSHGKARALSFNEVVDMSPDDAYFLAAA